MSAPTASKERIPIWHLYGEAQAFPDIVHTEAIADRAAGLGWRIAPHRHTAIHQVLAIRSGSAEITIDGQSHRPDAPFALNLPPGTVHGFAFSPGTKGVVVSLLPRALPDLFAPGTAFAEPLALPAILPLGTTLVGIVTQLVTEHDSNNIGRAVLVRAAALRLGAEVGQAMIAAGLGSGARCDPRLAAFDTLVQQHFRDNWSLDSYATALGLSPRHLARMTRAARGTSPRALIEAARITEASRLLIYTRDTVAEIGYSVGYNDPAYFSRAFRRLTGLAPLEYRRAPEKTGLG